MTQLALANQPNNLFFDLEIGGLRRIFEYPQIPMELSVILKPFAGTFSCTLMDDSGFAVEPHIWGAAQVQGVPERARPMGLCRAHRSDIGAVTGPDSRI